MGGVVAPFAGAWIEIRTKCLKLLVRWSLPSRERGLKCSWLLKSGMVSASLPSRERGLKYPLPNLCQRTRWSLPSRERGLK